MSAGSLTLGGNLSVAVGPLGRNAEGSGSVNTKGKIAAMYSYSKTKGLFGGVSVEGSIILERQDANRLAYGSNLSSKQILSGTFPPPNWAFGLIEEIDRCTGMPGGQKWQSWDEEGEGGGMGWSSPGKERGGYVFGEGVGAGGSPKASPKEGRRRGASVGVFDQSPVRPSPTKRTSSFNPFSSGSSSPKRVGAGMASSENYNAGLTWDSSGPMTSYGNRSRSGSTALRPAIDLEGRARSNSDPRARRGSKKEDSLLADEEYGDASDNTWISEDKGLSGSVAKLRLNGNRSRSNSKASPLASFEEDEYTPYETESAFARRKNGSRLTHEEPDPFGGESSTSGRAFEDYLPSPSPPRPDLQLKAGLTPGVPETGYARAIALFDLPAGQSGDLALKKGGVVYAMDKIGAKGDWWRGMNTSGEVGIFPANYVEVVEIPKEIKGGLTRGELKKRVPDLGFD